MGDRSDPVPASRLVPAAAIALLGLAGGLPAQGAPSALQFTPATLAAGDRGEVRLEAITEFSVKGFSISAAFDPAVLSIAEVTQRDTMCEALPVDYFQAEVDPAGALVMGILVDSKPPFDGLTFPGIGLPLPVALLTVEVRSDAPAGTTAIRFADGLGSPPIRNLLVVESESVRPDLLVDGAIQVPGGRRFLRADANGDGFADISDAIYLFAYLFQGRRQPGCLDAADTNADGEIDIADGILILNAIFRRSATPQQPYPHPGFAPAEIPGLGCKDSPF